MKTDNNNSSSFNNWGPHFQKQSRQKFINDVKDLNKYINQLEYIYVALKKNKAYSPTTMEINWKSKAERIWGNLQI